MVFEHHNSYNGFFLFEIKQNDTCGVIKRKKQRRNADIVAWIVYSQCDVNLYSGAHVVRRVLRDTYVKSDSDHSELVNINACFCF